MDLINTLSRDSRTLSIGVPGTLIVALLWMEFSVLSIASCLTSLFIGYRLALWLTISSDGQFLTPYVESIYNREEKEGESVEDRETAKIRKMPWHDLFVSKPLSDSLEQLLEQIVDKFVNNWYETGISRDRAFLHEIKYQIRFACSSLLNHLSKLDLSEIIINETLPVATLHLHRIVKIEEKIDKQAVPPSLLEAGICKHLTDLHFCLGNRANEADYLRQLSDYLLPRLLDDSRLAGRSHDDDSPSHQSIHNKSQRPWPSHPCRHFLRELLVHSILLPLLDLLADPDTLNHLLILLFDPEPGVLLDDNQSPRVPFLHGLTEQANETVPDSLLQLKLSELLRDAKQFSMFRLYLQDTRGPIAELKFLAEANRIHEVMQKKADNSSQITYDIWQLYGQFVHESASEKINFNEDTVEEFREAVESNDLEKLERIIEKTYQWVYGRLQYEYVVPFCQSETFLGHLCGSPPVSLDDIMVQRDNGEKRGSMVDKTFSLAQFRSRLRKVIALSFDEEDESSDLRDIEMDVTCLDQSAEQAEEAGMVVGTPMRPRTSFEISPSREDSEGIEEPSPPSLHPLSPLTTPPAHSHSMPDFQMPSIDISSVDDAINDDQGMVSPASAVELRDDNSTADSGMGVPIESTPLLVVDHETKDINRWNVTVPRIIPTRDSVNGRTAYVYVVQVDRHDAQEHETKTWTVIRRYNEFYVLEAKLNEFHGDSLHSPTLPPRKTFVTKNRAFIEQHRFCFAAFISNLCRQRLLCRSDLLFAFLASNDEFKDSLLLSDLNPWKVVKKMPGKLSRERGQNLRPFLLNLLANTLSPPERKELVKEKVDISEDSSLSSFSGEPPHSLYSPIFGNNLSNCKVGDTDDETLNTPWTSSFTDSLLLLIRLLVCVSPNWILSLLSSFRLLSKNAIDLCVIGVFRKILSVALHETYLVQLIHLTQQYLFCSEGNFTTEQEKSLRQELAKRRTVEWLEDTVPSHLRKAIGAKSFRHGILRLLQSLQYPRLNKQLSHVLLDVLVKKIFPQ